MQKFQDGEKIHYDIIKYYNNIFCPEKQRSATYLNAGPSKI